jgi:anhydro-N-acetylmuramic acid kinase
MTRLRTLNVLGLNSGTSLDGIDAALFRLSTKASGKMIREGLPEIEIELLDSQLLEFEPIYRNHLAKLLATHKTDLRTICLLNASLGDVFAQAAKKMQSRAAARGHDIDLIGSHGQTVWHAPNTDNFWGTKARGTLQLGDISIIAQKSGIVTVGDFRPSDMALGGQGAPLVSFADEVLFATQVTDADQAVGVLNLGGIANITVIHQGKAIMAFDTGPANVLIDWTCQKLFGKDFDADGEIAAQVPFREDKVEELLAQPYFKQIPPKTTGRELFGGNLANHYIALWQSQGLKPEEIVATLTAATAYSIARAYKDFIAPRAKMETLVVAGGGARNKTLLGYIEKFWPHPLKITSHEQHNSGVDPKFKEALLFALLAYTTFQRVTNNVPACTGASRLACLGKISFP